MRVVLAGGGTAGHVEPALNLADELRRRDASTAVVALGTASGLEATLVPQRGYELSTIPAVPLPRRPTPDLVRLPGRLTGAVKACAATLRRVDADAVVGFGGYVALPAYLAASRLRIPIVVHEGNARAGLANRVGARLTPWRAVNVPGALPASAHVGMPLRPAISAVERVPADAHSAARAEARRAFGLDADAPVLFAFGGSLGAQRLNAALTTALPSLLDAGCAVLHSVGGRNIDAAAPAIPGRYVPVPFVERMDLAYAAADLALSRAGAMTCAELTAVGLPSVYIPLAIGNGEQTANAEPIVRAGGGVLLSEAGMTPESLLRILLPLLTDPQRLTVMAAAAKGLGVRDGAARLADMVQRAAATKGERTS